MTLFNIARKNIRQNFMNYFLYFASMIFGIVIYFTFVSLKYDQTIATTSESSPKMDSIFSAASFVLLIFVAIFIWSSNAFFMRKRKKEVGLYSLLGVRRKEIGLMLFYENFLMGTFALVIGMGLGALLSKGFVALLMNMMGYEVVTNFTISSAAIINTAIVFLIITLVTSFQGYRLIYRFKLIELFQADQEGEHEPKASLWLAGLSLILIGGSYWLALQSFDSTAWQTLGLLFTPLVILTTVITGTYLLFSTCIVYALKASRKKKSHFWHGLTIITTSQLLYRIKGNARTLTIIAVLSATTLTAVGAAYSFYYNTKTTATTVTPNSYSFIVTDDQLAKQADELIELAEDHKLRYHQTINTLQVETDTTNLDSPLMSTELVYSLISTSDFNIIADKQGRKESLSLHGNEVVALDRMYHEKWSPKYAGKSITFHLNDREEVTFTDFKTYDVLNIGVDGPTLVVSDELFKQLASELKARSIDMYGITNADQAKELTKQLKTIMPEEAAFSSYYEVYAAGLESTGLLIFVGGFLGLVFLAATGSIIYFKQLTEAHADQDRYRILSNIGVNKKDLRKTIAKQVFFIFALPLLAGVTHSAVALTALSNLLTTNLIVPTLICMGVYMIIYIMYYFMTVQAYYKIVTNKGE
ncbi:FtsX-like permease family protein [Bacillus sp. REN10]|uniref:FtsX-like permease family protein n=1 Tax=Bacillus sp. REN10 TaxID=2782541 RepID=UPI00193C7290|nr:FtsX-like permease family protein [Bacillus sp. REN10]